MSQINIQNLTFAYDGSYDNIFEDVSFQIDTDWKLGFTGRNGRGKTTFLNLLCGKYEFKGKISASVEFDYFPFQVTDKTRSALDIIGNFQEWELKKELSLLDVPEEVLTRPFNTLSNGEQTKILLAALFLNENNFLLIDEPTNHLDTQGRKKVSQYLASKSGYILVSHDRAFLDGCVDHILHINKTNIEIQKGNFSTWYENKQRQDQFELAENAKLKKDIKRLEAAAVQSSKWANKVESTKMGKGANAKRKKGEVSIDTMAYNGEKSRRMQQRRKNLERRQQNAIEEKSSLLKNIDQAASLKIAQLTHHSNPYVSIKNLSISYAADCQNINFDINKGDRIALIGKNGSGKSSIIKLIYGEPINYTGEIIKPPNLQISYVSQDTSYLEGNLTDYAREKNIDESLFKSILRKLDFSRVQFDKSINDFSGGQKKKVLIAKSLCEKSHLLIWDEPLNFIDVLSRIQLEDLLLEYKPTILFVEHDRIFSEKLATKKVGL